MKDIAIGIGILVAFYLLLAAFGVTVALMANLVDAIRERL